MARVLLEKNAKSLSSDLMVLESRQSERWPAPVYCRGWESLSIYGLRYICDHEGKGERFKMDTCRVHRQLTNTQVLSLGFNRNREAADVYKLSCYDMVVNLLKIMKAITESDEETIPKKVCSLLNATTVSHIHHLKFWSLISVTSFSLH